MIVRLNASLDESGALLRDDQVLLLLLHWHANRLLNHELLLLLILLELVTLHQQTRDVIL